MKKILINNIGLKIFSLFAAIILWIVVVNVDDPTITRTYSAIPVEIENASAITDEGKTYEILEGSDTISVVVTAKRSVIEQLSRDYIKATADMKDITFMDTVHIDARVTRFSDRVDSVVPVTKNLKVKVEEMDKKQVEIEVYTEGSPAEGFILAGCDSSVNVMNVSGPKSLVDQIREARVFINIGGMDKDISTDSMIELYDFAGKEITDQRIEKSVDKINVKAVIFGTKTVPVSYSVSGVPAEGYLSTGVVVSNPDSVRIAGETNVISNIDSLNIPPEAVSIDGAIDDIVKVIDLSRYLPDKVKFADNDFDGRVTVTAYIGAVEYKTLDVPTVNISVENVPEGLSAVIVDIGGTKTITVKGLPEVLATFDGSMAYGVIDASNMIPRGVITDEITQMTQGDYDGQVSFALPSGITIAEDAYMEVILNAVAYVEPEVIPEELLPTEDNGL